MNKVALVTGGTRGIGKEIAESLARESFDIVVTGTGSVPTEVIENCTSFGVKAHFVKSDISSSADRIELLKEIRAKFGRLNLLVNNAGVAPLTRTDILEATEESYDRVLGINLKGPYFLTQLVAKFMIEQKLADPKFDAAVINISSVSAEMVSTGRGDYCLSKSGVAMMTKLYATCLGEYNIAVNEIRPGIIMTDMTAGVKEKYDKLIEEGLCIQKRWGQPNDVCKAVTMLARGEMPYTTGQVFYVDGGMSIARL